MPIYTYRCPNCRAETYATERGNRLKQMCRSCAFRGPLQRVWGFAVKPAMPAHYNNTLGRHVTNMQDFTDGLKAASEAATLSTGIEHNYQPLEWGDREAFGATGEGIDESNKVRSKLGEPLLPEID